MATGMNLTEMDDAGWAQIHYAAFNGYLLSIERFIDEDPELLDYETADGNGSTPFLLAVSGGNKDCIEFFIKKGAKLSAQNRWDQGAIEILLNNKNIELLQYFINARYPDLAVWRRLFRLLLSDYEEEALNAAECLEMLTAVNPETGTNPNWDLLRQEGGVVALIRLLRGNMADEAKVPIMMAMLNMLKCDKITDDMVKKGLIGSLVKVLKSEYVSIVNAATKLLSELARTPDYADQEVDAGLLPILVEVMNEQTEKTILVHVIQNFGHIAKTGLKNQNKVMSTPTFVEKIVELLQNYYMSKTVGFDLAESIEKFVKNNPSAQMAFINEGICSKLITMLTKAQNRDLQLSAVDAVHALAKNNPQTQKEILCEKLDYHLMQLFKKGRAEKLQEKTATCLWAIAGNEIEVQRDIAMKMGVPLLTGFVKSMTENLHYIGSEGLGVLAQGPISLRDEIAPNGAPSIVHLLRTSREDIVLSVTKTLRHLCVATGFVPHVENQTVILNTPGIQYLVALMAFSCNPLIQVESALTLGYICLGNLQVLESIKKNKDFSYSQILAMLDHQDTKVQLYAGLALASFAYNNLLQQKEMADLGGVKFVWFRPFLESEDEYFRCCSAFQVIVLTRIIPDKDQALTSATGIKILVDLLQNSTDNAILSLAADCVARLAHTRAGVPHAMISIDVVEYLCTLLLSPLERVRGNAAIALSYLAILHVAERQLLHKCRKEPILMKVLTHYSQGRKLPTAFQDGWKHYQKVGLPSIEMSQLNLLNQQLKSTSSNEVNIIESERELTLQGSVDENGYLSVNSLTPTSIEKRPSVQILISGDKRPSFLQSGDKRPSFLQSGDKKPSLLIKRPSFLLNGDPRPSFTGMMAGDKRPSIFDSMRGENSLSIQPLKERRPSFIR